MMHSMPLKWVTYCIFLDCYLCFSCGSKSVAASSVVRPECMMPHVYASLILAEHEW